MKLNTSLRAPDFATLLLLCSALAAGGCGNNKPISADPQVKNMKAVGILYGKFIGAHMGRIPESEQEFLKYASTHEQDLLREFRVAEVSELLRPPREGQPLVVVTGKHKLAGDNPIAAYEPRSINGTRIVVHTTGSVRELTEEQSRTLIPNDG
jgi:hypothetical protein